jgi:hypothetical protein
VGAGVPAVAIEQTETNAGIVLESNLWRLEVLSRAGFLLSDFFSTEH